MTISDLKDGRTQHSIHDLSKLCRKSCCISCPPRSWRFSTGNDVFVHYDFLC